MRLRRFIIGKSERIGLTQRRRGAEAQRFFYKFFFASLRLCVFALILVFPVFAQKIAVLTPDKTVGSQIFAAELGKSLSQNYKILDASLSEAAFRSNFYENPFNLSSTEAKNIGAAIGCDYFLLVKYETLRRSSFKKDEYYESYAVIFAVSSRTGNLVFWKLNSFETDKPSEAEKKLFDSIGALTKEISDALQAAKNREITRSPDRKIEELPSENSPETKNFRPPLPFRRIKPEYTATANFYDIEATVDILVDIDENGKILRTEITRWAGYGLDESVTEAVRKMNWRPAERSGKTLPMRILLRYNFKNIEDEN
jgi:TonB family protein